MNARATLCALFVSAAVRTAAAQAEVEFLYGSALWAEKAEKATGAYTIERDEDELVLKLSDDFSTKKAPDLKLVLSPLGVKEASAKNALVGGLVIAPLASPKGAQEYELPEGVDLEAYESLLIHCEQYTKLWGATALR